MPGLQASVAFVTPLFTPFPYLVALNSLKHYLLAADPGPHLLPDGNWSPESLSPQRPALAFPFMILEGPRSKASPEG